MSTPLAHPLLAGPGVWRLRPAGGVLEALRPSMLGLALSQQHSLALGDSSVITAVSLVISLRPQYTRRS
jgi:hypothetical protein